MQPRELVVLFIGDIGDEENALTRPAFINKPPAELIRARDAGCAKLGVRWHALCTGNPTIPIELGDQLKVMGFETAALPCTQAPRELEVVGEDGEDRAIIMTPPLFFDLFVFVCRLGDPALEIEVPEPFYIALGGAGLLSNGFLELEVAMPDGDEEDEGDEGEVDE